MTKFSSPKLLIREHPTLAASTALVVLACIRIFAFANFETTTALALLPVIDYIRVLLATLVVALSIFIPYMLLLNEDIRSWLFAGHKDNATPSAQWRTGLLAIPILVLVLLTMSVMMLIGFVGAVISIVILKQVVKRKEKKKPGSGKEFVTNVAHENRNLFAGTVGIVILVSVLSAPWVPLEAVQIKDQKKPDLGYFMGEQGNQTLLILKDKTPAWVPSENIEKRQVCQIKTSLILSSTVQAIRSTFNPIQPPNPDLCALAEPVPPVPAPAPEPKPVPVPPVHVPDKSSK